MKPARPLYNIIVKIKKTKNEIISSPPVNPLRSVIQMVVVPSGCSSQVVVAFEKSIFIIIRLFSLRAFAIEL